MSPLARRISVLVTAAALLVGCSSGEGDPVAAEPTPTETLTACVVSTPQLVEADARQEFVGFDVAVLEHVAQALDQQLAFVEVTFDDLVSGAALNGLTCEIGAGGVVEHDGLDAVATASTPYRAIDRLVVTAGAVAERVEPEGVTGTVGYVEGGLAEDGVAALAGAQLVAYPSLTDLERGVGTSEQDAWLVTVGEREQLTASLGLELGIVSRVPSGERTVLLLPLGADERLVRDVDDALAALQEMPEYAALRERWLDA